MRLAPLRLLAAGGACFIVGCGSSSSQLSPEAADRMNQALAATRAAAEAHDSEKTVGALRALSDIVRRESQEGRLSAAEERALRTAIAQARRRVELDVQSPPPQPTTTPPPPVQSTPVAPSEPEEKGDQEKDAEGDKGDEGNKDAKGDQANKDAKGAEENKDAKGEKDKGNGKGGG